MKPVDFGMTSNHLFPSMRHAAAITLAGFIVITAIGYSSSFKSPDIDYAWMAFYILVSVPVQEILFRGVLQKRLYKFGRRKAIITASILYSAIHFRNPLLMALTLAAGLLWGYSFSRHATLAGPAASHAVLGLYLFLFVL
ncbi:MAG: CPBP family intramembrane metalloprotease [Candidatus Aenigmarchaeota archaeon]|nr:CPBP family intramembrane metalloprotease [Candidatus Aenigmarchaeota archaeon]